jgi:low affinity Fe/Cu permease
MRDFFRRFAHRASLAVGSAWAFIVALIVILAWAITGPVFEFSDTWQLVINTGTTVITFLVVFIIQNTQNRDAKAVHLKLDELLRAVSGARTQLVELEKLSDEDLEQLQQEFHELHAHFAKRANEVSEEHGRRRGEKTRGRSSAE